MPIAIVLRCVLVRNQPGRFTERSGRRTRSRNPIVTRTPPSRLLLDLTRLTRLTRLAPPPRLRARPARAPRGFGKFCEVDVGPTVSRGHRRGELYQRAGVDLDAETLVGVGSVCRRQTTGEIEMIMYSLASLGIRLPGFGVEAGGLVRYADCLASADSHACRFEARLAAPFAGCRHTYCANRRRYAAARRARLLARLDVVQMHLWMAG